MSRNAYQTQHGLLRAMLRGFLMAGRPSQSRRCRNMAGKHRLSRRATSPEPPVRLFTIDMVDARTGAAHWVTDDAVAAGRRRGGRYSAVCGQLVLGASLTAAPRGTCDSCASIPAQRSRTSR